MQDSETITKEFHEHQWKILDAIQQFVAAIAGVQSGKTIVGAAWEAKKAADFPTDDHLIAAPTYKILNQSTLPKFFSEFPYYRQFYKKRESVIELPEGGHIYIRSTEDPFGLEGMTLRSAWADEGGQMKADFWTVIQARLAIKRGQLLITTTPYNMGWLYREFYKLWQAGDPNFLVANWSSEENPFFPKEEFERVRKTMPPELFDMRYRGVFRKRFGLVYPEFSDAHITDELPLAFNNVIGGLDWGFTNPAAISVIGQNYDQHYWQLDEWYERGKTTAEIIQKAKAFQAKYNVTTWYADSAEPDRIEEAKRAGLYVIPAEKDVKLGIDTVRQLIRENRFHVHRRCINTIDEFENYHYPEEGEAKYGKDEPVKEGDHLMDAIRYPIYTNNPVVFDPYEQGRINQIRDNKRRRE